MASAENIRIEFANLPGGERNDTPDPALNANEAKNGDASDAVKKANQAKAMAIMSLASQVTSQVTQTAEYFYGKYTSMNEDYIAQNNVTAARAIISKTTSMVGSIASGAQIGAAFGPTGSVVGAVVAAGVQAVNTGISIFQNYNNAYQALDEKAYSKYYFGARSGLVDGNRGTDN